MVETALGLISFCLLIRESGQTAGTPVDDIMTTVDQTALIEPNEDLPNRLREAWIEGETVSAQVERTADRLQLFEDRRAGHPDPFPDAFLEGLPAEIVTTQPLLCQLTLDYILRRDTEIGRASCRERV